MTTPTTHQDPRTSLTHSPEFFAEILADEAAGRRDMRARLLRDEDVQVTVAQRECLDRTLDEIAAAQARLADGSFGTCVHCGATIPEGRLEARPWAATCTGCTDS